MSGDEGTVETRNNALAQECLAITGDTETKKGH